MNWDYEKKNKTHTVHIAVLSEKDIAVEQEGLREALQHAYDLGREEGWEACKRSLLGDGDDVCN